MLKATVVTPKQAEHYYRQENYYSKKESVQNSQWSGKGAKTLGLNGNIQGEDFSNLLYGDLPNGERFRKRPPTHSNYKERAGVDLTFSAPKSVSLAVLVNNDQELEKAHREAVQTTLSIAEERYANTRIRDKESGTRNTVTTGNFIVAQFHHDTSREKDPQLHTHAVVINGTQNSEGKWYSLNSDELFRQQKLLGTIYQNELAVRAQKLGYEIEQRENGQFDLKGYSQEHLAHFSKRRSQILETISEGASRKQIELAALKTRKPKGKEISREELQKYWQAEAQAISLRHPQPNKIKQKKAIDTSDRAIDEAIEHCSERNVNFKREDLEKFVLSEIGNHSWHDIHQAITNNQDLIKTKGQDYTTFPALNRELDTIKMVVSSDKVKPIVNNSDIAATIDQNLTEGQKAAIALATTTENPYIAWQGKAGVGKTYALNEFKKIAESNGYFIKGYAPSASAAKVLGDELGIKSNTVARKLISQPLEDEKLQQQIWIVDEAGLLDAKNTHSMLKKAKEENARILFVGDTRQLSSVEAGNPFKSLQQAGMETAYLNQSLRQKTADLKSAVEQISEGEIALGVKILDDNERIEETKEGKRTERIAEDYLSLSIQERNKTLILAGTHADRKEILNQLRTQLRAEGTLGQQEISGTRLKSKDLTRAQMRYAHHYQIGDTVMPLRNYGELEKGKLYRVSNINQDILTLDSNSGSFQVNPSQFAQKAVYEQQKIDISSGDRLKWTKNNAKLNRINGQEFTVLKLEDNNATIKYDNSNKTEDIDLSIPQNFDHALVSTTYSSQGKTANRVLVSATSDKTLSKESFYVAASRAKYNLTIYSQNKEQLLARVKKSQANHNPLEMLDKHENIVKKVDTNLQGIFNNYYQQNQQKNVTSSTTQKTNQQKQQIETAHQQPEPKASRKLNR